MIKFRHYTVTHHALERYRQRTGGAVESLFETLNESGLLTHSKRNSGQLTRLLSKAERAGHYLLGRNGAVFVIDGEHRVVTFINVGG